MSDPATWRRTCEALGVSPERIRRVVQRHTRCVMVAGECSRDATRPADGVIAGTPNDVLCVTVADCLPIFLIPRDGRLPALLHSGWRGTGIVTDALACLERRFGRSPGAYHAIVGPRHRPVLLRGSPRSGRSASANDSVRRLPRRQGARGRIDLRAANIALLYRAGIAGITVYDDCTACSPALLSFRADRAGRPRRQPADGGAAGKIRALTATLRG